MASTGIQDYTGYIEVDPNTRIAVSASRVTWTDLARNETAYVYDDFGAAFFAGDFTHTLGLTITAGDLSSALFSAVWLITNTVDEYKGIRNNDALALVFFFSGATPNIRLIETVGGSNSESSQFNITIGTTYYMTITRDETVGANGTLTCKIYSDATRTTLLDTLSRTLNVKNDFRYIYAFASYDTSNANKHSGYTENLKVYNVTAGYIVEYPEERDVGGGVQRVTGLVHVYDRVQNIYDLEFQLGEVSVDRMPLVEGVVAGIPPPPVGPTGLPALAPPGVMGITDPNIAIPPPISPTGLPAFVLPPPPIGPTGLPALAPPGIAGVTPPRAIPVQGGTGIRTTPEHHRILVKQFEDPSRLIPVGGGGVQEIQDLVSSILGRTRSTGRGARIALGTTGLATERARMRELRAQGLTREEINKIIAEESR